jgi:hypothetical protein
LFLFMLNEHITIGKQSRHRVYVRDWQKKPDKSKIRRKATETKFWKALSRLTYPFSL